MAIIGLSKVEEQEVWPPEEDETPEDQRTYFTIGAIDVDIRNALTDRMNVSEMTKEGAMRQITRGHEINTDLCRIGLRGWRNFRNEVGAEIPFVQAIGVLQGKQCMLLKDECLAAVPPHVIMWLGQEILERNSATEATRKKLKALWLQLNSSGTSTAPNASGTASNGSEDAPKTDQSLIGPTSQES